MEMSAEVNFGDKKLTRDVLPGLFVTGEGFGRWSGTMCDSCNTKINLISRKTCTHCQLHFCITCMHHPPRSPHVCRRCSVFTSPVIERAQLQRLTILDLKYYAKNFQLGTSLNPSGEELIEVILSRQANTLVNRANKAIQQLTGIPPDASFTNFDASQFQPTVSAYSTSGAGGTLYSGSNEKTSEGVDGVVRGGGAGVEEGKGRGTSPGDERLHIRKKVKKSVDLAHVGNIDEVDNEEDIDELSVKQLKIILQRNCINYKGCVEKTELLAKVKTLWNAREEEKKLEAKICETGDIHAESEFLCKVCMDAPVDCVLLECGHMLTCVRCGRQLAECPVCRQYVSRVVHAFRV